MLARFRSQNRPIYVNPSQVVCFFNVADETTLIVTAAVGEQGSAYTIEVEGTPEEVASELENSARLEEVMRLR